MGFEAGASTVTEQRPHLSAVLLLPSAFPDALKRLMSIVPNLRFEGSRIGNNKNLLALEFEPAEPS